jgi:starch-binding outer membrane protein, SusD/RagB family
MKNKLYILFTALSGLLLLGVTSCNNEEYLKVDRNTLEDPNMFLSDDEAQKGLIGCYDLMYKAGDINNDGSDDIENDGWGIKPNLFVGSHPTMETTATGWDKQWNTQSWNAGSSELLAGWSHAYKAIGNCNNFLSGLAAADTINNITPSLAKVMDGEARCIRAFFYDWLAKTFGRVPLLETGETYFNTPSKARAKDYAEMWDFIIADLKIAKAELDWDPYGGQAGRMTKGFAISYLAECYMWKAYKIPAEAKANYTLAAAELKEVVESKKYELNPSFTTLWDPGAVWTKEAVWETVYDEGSGWNFGSNLTGAHDWFIYFTAFPGLNGWGTLYLSWEWWSSYEKGDKRRDASGVTGLVKDINPDWKSETNYGYHPYLQQSLSASTHYKWSQSGELAPAIWSLKYWRTCRSDWNGAYSPIQVYYKRYANVLLDYAECLFRLNDGVSDEAWGYIKDIRNRAFGNLEVGKSAQLTATYLPYYQDKAYYYYNKGDHSISKDLNGKYPIPFNETLVNVPDAKDYYTQLKADKGFTSDVWLVALGMERLKECNAEWTVAPDLIRSGFIQDHIEHNYPKGVGTALDQDNWHTVRTFDFSLQKMDMPIPTNEIQSNPALANDQNPGY